jgi:hypothetical protein
MLLASSACEDARLSPREGVDTETKNQRPQRPNAVARTKLMTGIQTVLMENRSHRAERKSSAMMSSRAERRRLSVYNRMETTIQRNVPFESRATARQMMLMLRQMWEVMHRRRPTE